MISLRNVSKYFQGRKVIDNVSLDVFCGETFLLMGCSGSGKSTLLRLMTGIIKPDEGNVYIKGKDISALSSQGLEEVRRSFGMLFQYSALLDSLTVKENVALPLREHSKLAEDIINIIIKMKLALVGLKGFESYYPSQISGGMRKRVGLARAIALDPDIVFYDEPTSGLDPVVGGVIDKLIKDLSAKLLITSVVVTHDMKSVFAISDRAAMVNKGRIVDICTPQELKNSSNPYIRQFVEGSPEGPIGSFREDIDVHDMLEL
ncbi:MAG: ATP-binding cassette domain-containing protein [Candidatus Omnitrophica bacterium]|nr:ATP-binding cassette domain-containing protein [Candidatus Omnitrophota bacterium]MBD3269039.1 ATP-binding cassette domain-containing protein [Candidatus Omnitrophota bacterium]